jgi:hypothetical protein
VPLDVEGNAFEHFVLAVRLVDVVDLEERHLYFPALRAVSRSIK